MKNNAFCFCKTLKNGLLLAFLLLFNLLQAQDHTWWINTPEGREQLQLDNTQVLVDFSESIDAAKKASILEKFSKQLIATNLLDLPQWDATVLPLQAGLSQREVYTLLTDLNQTPGIRYGAPFLRHNDGTLLGVLDQINVGIKKPSDLSWVSRFCRENGLELPTTNEFDQTILKIKVTDNRMGRALEVAEELTASGRLLFAEVNFILVMTPFNTNDPLRPAQWSQTNTGSYWNGSNWVNVGISDADMDVTEAWSITKGTSSIKVAVIDDGVQTNHPDLAANMLSGYDAIGQGTGGNPTGNDLHGTACAGIIAATGNNNLGLVGNAYQCKIIPVRVGYTPPGQNVWFSTPEGMANGINWSWQTAGAAVLSNSWGGGPSSSIINTAITNAVVNGRNGKGSLVFFATGNDDVSSVSFPARYADAIAVGASNMCDTRKRKTTSCDGETNWGSNYGTGIDVVAPGVKIVTTDLTGGAGANGGDYNLFFNGTSSACPNAASVGALILSVNNNLTYAQARAILESTCEKVGGYSYNSNSNQLNGSWNSEMGYGRVNARNACQAAQTPTCSSPTTAQLSATNITSSSAKLNCNVSGVERYDWAYRLVGASSWTDLSSTTANNVSISGLQSNKQYEFKAAVRCNGGTWSSWSAVKTFNTSSTGGSAPANDPVCNASPITAGSSCSNTSGTTSGATPTFTDALCGTTNPKDVWYKCVIPSTGKVTFRTTAGSLTDAVMAVFWGSSCTSLSYVACEDDNSNGNGSYMPVMTITGQAGTQLWIRVWGYNNAGGTFSICAMNYSTANFNGEPEGPVYHIDPTQMNPYPVEKVQPEVADILTDRDQEAEKTDMGAIGKVYPNPSTGFVTLPLILTEEASVDVMICDVLGSVVYRSNRTEMPGEHQLSLDLGALQPGIYTLRCSSGELTQVQQLQVMR
jgi:subtilisin family serine protease